VDAKLLTDSEIEEITLRHTPINDYGSDKEGEQACRSDEQDYPCDTTKLLRDRAAHVAWHEHFGEQPLHESNLAGIRVRLEAIRERQYYGGSIPQIVADFDALLAEVEKVTAQE
jgi:hypothetical protein